MHKLLTTALATLSVIAPAPAALASVVFLTHPSGDHTPLSLNVATPSNPQSTMQGDGTLNLALVRSAAAPTDMYLFRLSAALNPLAPPRLLSTKVIAATSSMREQRLAGTQLLQSFQRDAETALYPLNLGTAFGPVPIAQGFPNEGAQIVRAAPLSSGGYVVLRSNNEAEGAQRVTLLERYASNGSMVWSQALAEHPSGFPVNTAALDVSGPSMEIRVAFIAARSGTIGDPNRDFVLISLTYGANGMLLYSREHDIVDGSTAKLFADANNASAQYVSYRVDGISGTHCYYSRVPAAPASINNLISGSGPACVPAMRIGVASSGTAAVFDMTGLAPQLHRFDNNGTPLYVTPAPSPGVNTNSAVAVLSDDTVVTAAIIDTGSGNDKVLRVTHFDNAGIPTLQPDLLHARSIISGAGVPSYELQATPDGGYVAIYDAIDPNGSMGTVLGVTVSKRFVD